MRGVATIRRETSDFRWSDGERDLRQLETIRQSDNQTSDVRLQTSDIRHQTSDRPFGPAVGGLLNKAAASFDKTIQPRPWREWKTENSCLRQLPPLVPYGTTFATV